MPYQIRENKGFTLPEVLIVLTILAAAGLASVPYFQSQAEEALTVDGISQAELAVNCYKRFRTQERRNPNNMAELLGANVCGATGQMPWGANIGGATDALGRSYSFSFNARDAVEAEKMARGLNKYSATSAGTLVTFTTPMPTIETISRQMLCREAVVGDPNCNRMEVDLDVNNNDLDNIGNITAQNGDLDQFIARESQIDTLNTTSTIQLGANSISHAGNTLFFNSANTSFTGNMEITGTVNGNGGDITGFDNIDVQQVTAQDVAAQSGVISALSGQSLNYQQGTFGNVDADSVTTDSATFNDFVTNQFSAQSVQSVDFTSTNVTAVNGNINQATGQSLSLSNTLQTTTLTASNSTLGTATGTSLSVAGMVTGGQFLGGPASFASVVSRGNVTGTNFTGTNFTTGISSVNNNKSLIDAIAVTVADNSSRIAANQSANAVNAQAAANNTTELVTLKQGIDANTAANTANAQRVASNVTAISTNRTLIGDNDAQINAINNGITLLEQQWRSCVNVGGCQ